MATTSVSPAAQHDAVRKAFAILQEMLKSKSCALADTSQNGFYVVRRAAKGGTLQYNDPQKLADQFYAAIVGDVNDVIRGAESMLDWTQEPPALLKHRRQKGSETVHSANRSQRAEEPVQEEKQPISPESKRMLEKIYHSIEDPSRRSSVRSYLDDFYEVGSGECANAVAHRIQEYLKIEPLRAAENYLNSGQGADVRDIIAGGFYGSHTTR